MAAHSKSRAWYAVTLVAVMLGSVAVVGGALSFTGRGASTAAASEALEAALPGSYLGSVGDAVDPYLVADGGSGQASDDVSAEKVFASSRLSHVSAGTVNAIVTVRDGASGSAVAHVCPISPAELSRALWAVGVVYPDGDGLSRTRFAFSCAADGRLTVYNAAKWRTALDAGAEAVSTGDPRLGEPGPLPAAVGGRETTQAPGVAVPHPVVVG